MFYTNLPKRTQGNLASLYKSEEEIGLQAIQTEEADNLMKGRKGEPIGTRKTWGNTEYVKTAQGWKSSSKVKAAHDAIHGKPEAKYKVKLSNGKETDLRKPINHEDYKDISADDHKNIAEAHSKMVGSAGSLETSAYHSAQSTLHKEKYEEKKELTPDEHGAEAAKHFDAAHKEYFKGNYEKQDEHHQKGHEHLMHALGKQKDKFNAVYNNPDVKHITVGGSNKPLSSQLQAIHGDHYNAQDYDGDAGTGSVITHKKSGQKYTVINHKQADLVKHYQDKNKPEEKKEESNVIGKTKSGKDIHSNPEHEAHKDFSGQDHKDAYEAHMKKEDEIIKNNGDVKKFDEHHKAALHHVNKYLEKKDK